MVDHWSMEKTTNNGISVIILLTFAKKKQSWRFFNPNMFEIIVIYVLMLSIISFDRLYRNSPTTQKSHSMFHLLFHLFSQYQYWKWNLLLCLSHSFNRSRNSNCFRFNSPVGLFNWTYKFMLIYFAWFSIWLLQFKNYNPSSIGDLLNHFQ